MTVDEVIGRNVHHLMWDKRIQHREVYEAMGLSRSSLSKKLRGEVTWTAKELLDVAAALDVSPAALYGELPQQRATGTGSQPGTGSANLDVTGEYHPAGVVVPFPGNFRVIEEQEHLAPVHELRPAS